MRATPHPHRAVQRHPAKRVVEQRVQVNLAGGQLAALGSLTIQAAFSTQPDSTQRRSAWPGVQG